MIKDVFSSIAASSGSGKTGALTHLKGKGDENTEAGFFGNLFKALQNEGDGKAESGEIKLGESEVEENETQESEISNKSEAVVTESSDLTEIDNSESSAENPGGEGNDTEIDNNVSLQNEAQITDTEKENTTSPQKEEQVYDTEKKISSNAESNPGENRGQSQPATNKLESDTVTDSSETEKEGKLNLRTSENPVQDAKESGRVSESSGNIRMGGEVAGQRESGILKEGNSQNQSIGTAESAGEKKILSKAEPGIKVGEKSEDAAGIQRSQKEAQVDQKTGERERFFDLGRTSKSEPVRMKNVLVENHSRSQTQDHTTVRANPRAEQINRGLTAQVDLKDHPQLQTDMINAQRINAERAKRYDLLSQNLDGRNVSGERLTPVAGSTGTGANQHGMSFSSQPNWIQFQTNSQHTAELTDEQQAFFNEHVMESAEASENGTTEQAKINMNRLAEMPINNVILRRSILPGLTGALQRATAAGKEMPQTWQKHSFELDDGNRINLSTRNVDGVLQVKISSGSIELSKLMQQYGQEIEDHLENECEIDVDLQFEGGQGEAAAEFSDNSSSFRNRKGSDHSSENRSGKVLNKKVEEDLQQTVRKFGYNQMEWTI